MERTNVKCTFWTIVAHLACELLYPHLCSCKQLSDSHRADVTAWV